MRISLPKANISSPRPITPHSNQVRPGWFSRAVRLTLMSVVLYFVGQTLATHIFSLSWSQVNIRPLWLIPAFLSLLAAKFTVLLVYRPLLEPFCGLLGFRQLAPLSWLPPLGRYIPGKVMSIGWSISMLRKHVASPVVAISIPFLVTGLAILVGLMVSLPLTLWHPVKEKFPSAWMLSFVLLPGGVICLCPGFLKTISSATLRLLGREAPIILPSPVHYLTALAAILAQVAMAGVTLWLLAQSMTDVPIEYLPILISGSGLAASMGFIAIFAPAGIGVREGILLIILIPIVGEGIAASLVIGNRCLQTIGDMLLAGVGWVVRQNEG